MAGAGSVVKRLIFVVAVLMAGVSITGVASAAGPAKAGSTFSTSFLTLPKGAIPGGESGLTGGNVDRSALSANGRFVAFVSAANALSRAADPDITNVFRKDQTTGKVELVSRASGANGAASVLISFAPRISGNGNLVAFVTKAALSPTDLDGESDVYTRNLATKTTRLETPATPSGVFSYDISADGQFLAFSSPDVLVGTDNNGTNDIFRRDLGDGTVALVSRIPANGTAGDGSSYSPSISGDGRWVAFESDSSNITAVPYIDHNGGSDDVVVRDMVGAQTYLVSCRQDSCGHNGNGESGEAAIAGSPAASNQVRIAYSSNATDVGTLGVDLETSASIYLKSSLDTAPSELVSQSTGGENADSRANSPRISASGNLIFFSSDANNLGPVPDYYGAYLRNTGTGTTTLGSAKNNYAIAGDISANGNMIVWSEAGGATPDSDAGANGVFTRKIPGGPVRFASRPPGSKPFILPGASVGSAEEGARTISANGRYIVIAAVSSRLGAVPNGQIFRRDLATGKIELASRRSGAKGAKSEGSSSPSVSSDGNRVAFRSFSPLVAADTDDEADAYVRDFRTKTTTLVSRADGAAGADANERVDSVAISGNGRTAVFATDATNLGVPAGDSQIYVRDLVASKTLVVSRATGNGGVVGNGDSGRPAISNDGRTVAFESRSTNLDPDDANNQRDVYVRNLAADTLLLASRLPGLNGAHIVDLYTAPAISGDGKVVAFSSEEESLVPGTGPWPVNENQVVTRVLSNGTNSLASRSEGGLAADRGASAASLNRDGTQVAFESSSTNLLPNRGGNVRPAVFVKNMNTGKLVGPPAFGLDDNEPQNGARAPSLSDNGRCVAFVADGHNRISGDSSDLNTSYVYTVSGTCTNPRGIPKPRLSGVSVRGASTATIRFRLNTKATVTATFKRRAGTGYVAAGKLVRKNQKAGKRVLRKSLRAGSYRVTMSAKNGVGRSRPVTKTFRVRR